MDMEIIVCIKQVPDTRNVHLDPETHTLKREGVESIVNPFDMYAVETALRLKDEHGGTVTAMTMGLETCYIGLFEAAARNYPPVIENLSLPSGNDVCSVLILGYPRMKYHRTVDRKPIEVRWE